MDTGHWQLGVAPFDYQDHVGFVYCITNLTNQRKYIGQKQLHSAVTRPPLKGRKNKRRSKRESDWREYTGSSRQLNEDISVLGKHKFKFEILELCDSKWELNYAETRRIVFADALRKHEYYNEFLGRLGRCPESLKV